MQLAQELRTYAEDRKISYSFDGRNCTVHEIFPSYPQRFGSERRVRNRTELLNALWKSASARLSSIESFRMK